MVIVSPATKFAVIELVAAPPLKSVAVVIAVAFLCSPLADGGGVAIEVRSDRQRNRGEVSRIQTARGGQRAYRGRGTRRRLRLRRQIGAILNRARRLGRYEVVLKLQHPRHVAGGIAGLGVDATPIR